MKTGKEQIKQYLDKLDPSNWLGQIQFVLRYPAGECEAVSEPFVVLFKTFWNMGAYPEDRKVAYSVSSQGVKRL